MRIVKIILLMLLVTGVHAQSVKWQKLKPFYAYGASAFHLKNTVSVMEIRRYGTPAEAQLILWLHSKREGTKYRKISKGYEIIIKYEKTYPSNKGDGKIAEICEEIREVTERAIVNKKGKIISYKQVGIAKKGRVSCMHPAQNIVYGVYQ